VRRALIGYTGFVGSNLAAQGRFDALYNSRNIETIRGEAFDEIVCAGISAVKWWANTHPEEDMHDVQRLLDSLGHCTAERFTLISTVDVYACPDGVDETTPVGMDGLHAYGRHRRLAELFCRERFARCMILRLPGVFGMGLKKNAIYDLLHANQVDNIHPDAVYQFYDLGRIHADMETARAAGLDLVNLATEPVSMRQVARHAFGREFGASPGIPAPRYDMRTVHASVFGGTPPYLQTARQVLDGIAAFVAVETRAQATERTAESTEERA